MQPATPCRALWRSTRVGQRQREGGEWSKSLLGDLPKEKVSRLRIGQFEKFQQVGGVKAVASCLAPGPG